MTWKIGAQFGEANYHSQNIKISYHCKWYVLAGEQQKGEVAGSKVSESIQQLEVEKQALN